MAESKEELKSLLMKVKEESEKVVLKLNIQKAKIMASGPITSWQIDGETVRDFICGVAKSLQMLKKCLLLVRKTMTNLDSILKKKQRHYFGNKGLSSQRYGFPSSMYGCKSWAIKKS